VLGTLEMGPHKSEAQGLDLSINMPATNFKMSHSSLIIGRSLGAILLFFVTLFCQTFGDWTDAVLVLGVIAKLGATMGTRTYKLFGWFQWLPIG
jgi:hypothetical protein